MSSPGAQRYARCTRLDGPAPPRALHVIGCVLFLVGVAALPQALLSEYKSESMQWTTENLDAAMNVLMTSTTKHIVWSQVMSLYVKDSIEVLTRHGVRIDAG